MYTEFSIWLTVCLTNFGDDGNETLKRPRGGDTLCQTRGSPAAVDTTGGSTAGTSFTSESAIQPICFLPPMLTATACHAPDVCVTSNFWPLRTVAIIFGPSLTLALSEITSTCCTVGALA